VSTDAVADELFALPAEEFVAARDALVRDLGREGRPEDARAVRTLRRPTRSAAALNHLARERPEDVRRLIGHGDAMRAALGKGDRAGLDAARAAATDEIGELVAGVESGEAVRREVAESLWAAVADERAAADLLAARLERPLENPGLAGLAGLPAPPPRTAHAARAEEQPAPRPSAADERRRRQAEQKVERARARVADAQAALERAEHALTVAERDLSELRDD
jgi:hypothetical protein